MKKIVLAILLALTCEIISSQEKLIELNDTFSYPREIPKQSFSIPNQVNGELTILFDEKKELQAQLFDSNYKSKAKIKTKALSKKYKNLIGYNIYNDIYSVFFSNEKNTKFGVQILDFKNKTSEIKFLKNFSLTGEKYIEAVNYKNKIHLLTSKNYSSEVNIYTFNPNFESEKRTISLKEIEMESPFTQGYILKASELFTQDSKSGTLRKTIEASKIEYYNPNTIETTSKKLKLYQQGKIVVLSLDHNVKETKLCYINLESLEITYKTFDKPSEEEIEFKKSNSYLYDDKLFQIVSSAAKMKFTVLDINTNKIIKEYTIGKQDSITFKNSPIIQEGSMTIFGFSENQTREMEKTTKYLRKISQGNLGISVFKTNNNYNIVLGGIQEIITSRNFRPGFGGTASRTPLFFNVSYNPTSFEFNKYTSSKSTYIKCLFDENLEHIKGKIGKNRFDKIRNFERKVSYFTGKNIFLHNGKIHYGLYHTKDEVYRLYKFK